MARKGNRDRIGSGIYRDAGGVEAQVRIGKFPAESKRFPAATAIEEIKLWQDRTRAQLRARYLRQRPGDVPTPQRGARGTLGVDVPNYLAQVAHLASLKARSVEARAWIEALGPDAVRTSISRADVMRTRAAWLKAGTSPKTINNRVQTLRHVAVTLDADEPRWCRGAGEYGKVGRLQPLAVPRTPPVPVGDGLIAQVDRTLREFERVLRLPDQKTRARFRVYASTGKRPSEIMRAVPSDVDLDRREWRVRDGKGGWGPGVYLNDDMLAAWQLFRDADAWGPYDTNSAARVYRGAGWPAGVRPYNLRHSTLIAAVDRGADHGDVQNLAGHKSLATTKSKYTGIRSGRMRGISESLNGRFDAWGDAPRAEDPVTPAARAALREAIDGLTDTLNRKTTTPEVLAAVEVLIREIETSGARRLRLVAAETGGAVPRSVPRSVPRHNRKPAELGGKRRKG